MSSGKLTLSEKVSSPVSSPEDAPLPLSFDVACLSEVANDEPANLSLGIARVALDLCCRMMRYDDDNLVSITNPETRTTRNKKQNKEKISG